MTNQDDPILPLHTAENTPRSRTSAPVRIAGFAVLAFLIIAVILLALGIFNFEDVGLYGS